MKFTNWLLLLITVDQLEELWYVLEDNVNLKMSHYKNML